MLRRTTLAYAVVAAFGMLSSIGTAQSQDPIKWDLPGYFGINAPSTKLLSEFADAVKERTNGKLLISVRAAGELPYPATDYHRVVGRGDIQMADTAWLAGDVPASGALTLPLLVRDFSELRTAMETVGPDIDAGLKRFGAKVLFFYSFPVANFWGTGDAPKTLGDFSGLKIRGITPEHAELITALGAAPATIATPEVMTALQYGTVNTAITSAYGLTGAKWDSLITWTFTVNLAPSPSFVVVNLEAYEALPPEVRTVLDEVAKEHQEKMLDTIEQDEISATKALVDKGLITIKASDEDIAKLTPVAEGLWQKWPANRGPEAQKALDALRSALNR